MRARNIKPGFWENEMLGRASHTDRLLFIGLWCLADRDGKLEDRQDRIRHQLFGYDRRPVEVEKSLCHLASLHVITRYDVAGQRYISIPNFKRHQFPHPHEAKSKIPDPVRQSPGVIACNDMSCNVTLNPESGILNPDPPIVPHPGDESLETFWKAYPRRIGKNALKRAWAKAKDKPSIETLLAALEKHKASEQWKKESGRYIPHPATWINQGRWHDEIETRGGTWKDKMLDAIKAKEQEKSKARSTDSTSSSPTPDQIAS